MASSLDDIPEKPEDYWDQAPEDYWYNESDGDAPGGEYVLKSWDMSYADLVFAKSFLRRGMIHVGKTSVQVSDGSLERALELIKEYLGSDIIVSKTNHNEYFVCLPETLVLKVKSTNSTTETTRKKKGLRIVFEGFGVPESVKLLNSAVEDLEKERRTSRYWIYIRESYWSKRNDCIADIPQGYPETAFSGNIPELYTGVNVNKLLNLYFQSSENILMTVGEPGTGKTHLIRKVIHDLAHYAKKDLNVVYTKDIAALKSDEFWAGLHGELPDLLVLDDLDSQLIPRSDTKSDEESIVGKLLSFSNGVFPINTKILITTNLDDQAVDLALVRPGRCLDVLKLKPMDHAKARELWHSVLGLDVQTFDKIFNGHESIIQAWFMSEAARITNSRDTDYLLDPTTSVRDDIIRKNAGTTIGFRVR